MSDNDTSHPWLDKLNQILHHEPQNREELLTLLRQAQEKQLLDAHALGMIEGVLQVSEMQVRDIMVPRSQMIVVNAEDPLSTTLPHVIESGHSRFPVIGEDRDEILGILLAKELLPVAAKPNEEFNIRDVCRVAIFVPESKRLDSLLQQFRRTRNHMAIVVDEYGGVSGLVTIEDVLEQIVGEIEDELDIEEGANIRELDDQTMMVKALTPIEEFNEHFQCDLPDDEFDTIGGLVMHYFGHVPKRNEVIELEVFSFKVVHADTRRVHLLQVTKNVVK